ncbi:MAG: PaaI family thioesterase [Prevotella sp.]|nr:PaaI family thioesterase [Prevotella sp.]MDY4038980.1 PaaI family thioesterase [Prevotella sp.]
MRKIKNPWVHKEGYDCFGCSPDNPLGLHMEFFESGDEVISFWRPQGHYQGWIGVMHGGILSTLIDETAGWIVMRKLQTAGMTAKLDIRFKHPVMASDNQLTIRGHIVDQKRNIVVMQLTLENGNSEVCVEAEATYYAFDEQRAKEMGFCGCEVEDEQLLSM